MTRRGLSRQAPIAHGNVSVAACVLLAGLLSGACVGARAEGSLERVGVEDAPAGLFSATARHVIIVTIDGLRADLVAPEQTPNLLRMAGEGAFARRAQTVKPSLTLPAHSSLVSGVCPAVHGIYWNSYKPERGTIELTTIFDVAQQAGLRTSMFAGKPKLKHLIYPGSVDHVEIDKERSDLEIMQAAIDRLRVHPDNLVLVHLPWVDRFGHRYGWDSKNQLRALRRADAAVGQLLTFLEEEGVLEGGTVVIVTADHGGHSRHHADSRAPDTGIPWIVWGEAVSRGQVASVTIRATAATALNALNLDPAALGHPRVVAAVEEADSSGEVLAAEEMAP